MQILWILTLLFFQLSMLPIVYFIVEFSLDLFKNENTVGKVCVTITGLLLTTAGVLTFIASFLALLQMF